MIFEILGAFLICTLVFVFILFILHISDAAIIKINRRDVVISRSIFKDVDRTQYVSEYAIFECGCVDNQRIHKNDYVKSELDRFSELFKIEDVAEAGGHGNWFVKIRDNGTYYWAHSKYFRKVTAIELAKHRIKG